MVQDSRSEYKEVMYVSKQLSLAVNYLLDSEVRDPESDIIKLLNDATMAATWMFYVYN